MISFGARRRQVVRQERRDQIRRELGELADRCEAGDPDPWHLQRPGESDRQYRRRVGRPDLAARRAALLLAERYWDAGRQLPDAIGEALCAVSTAPRTIRRMLAAIWDRKDVRVRESSPWWTPALSGLPTGTKAGKVARWRETCLHTGPPAGVVALEAPVISP